MKRTLSPKEIGDKLGINWKTHCLEQFKKGLRVEAEHKDVTRGDPLKTGRIVFAHLKEKKNYYDLLKDVESKKGIRNGKKTG